MENSDEIGESCTNAILNWINGAETGTDPDHFPLQRHSSAEVRRLALGSPDFLSAAELLHAWFTDRLTVEPGVRGPFAPVAYTLIMNALELVNWYQVAEELRG